MTSDARKARRLAGAVVSLLVVAFLATSGPAARADTPPRLPSEQLFVVRDPAIAEASGMVASRLHAGVIYLVNDSGNEPVIHAVGADGATRAVLRLNYVTNVDWEAMAPGVDEKGRPTLLIGDIGDNGAKRPGLRVYEVREPTVLQDDSVSWRRIDLRYPDGPHDAEALLREPSGQLFVVTKEALGAGTYAVPTDAVPGGTYTMERVGGAPMFVTDGAISPDGSLTVLRTYRDLVVVDGPGGAELARYRLPVEPQGESVAFTADGSALLVASEGARQPVYQVDLPTVTTSPSAAPSGSSTSDSPSTDSDQPSSRAGLGLALGVVVAVVVGLVAVAVVALRRRRRP
jgi:hypothetical protein